MTESLEPSTDRFLQEQATEGTYHSEGQFTLGAQAVTKMAKYAFADESLWLVRMVQAAVAAGATSISIKQTVTATEILFEPGAAFYADEVIAALGTTEPYPGPAVSLLVSGLQAVAMGQNRAFSLEFTDHLRYRYVSYLRGKLCVGDSANERKVTPKQQIKLSVAWPGYYRHTALPEMATLTERARICPIEVRLDGRVINNVFAPKPPEPATSLAYLALGAFSLPGTSLRELRCPGVLSSSETHSGLTPMARLNVPQGPRHAVFQLVYYYQVLSWDRLASRLHFEPRPQGTVIHWLRYGVISESEELREPFAAVASHLYLEASDIPTDASGFKLRGHEELRETRKKEAITQVLPYLPVVLKRVENSSSSRIEGPPKRPAKILGTALLGLGAWTLCPLWTQVALIAGGLGLNFLTLHQQKMRVLRACQEELRSYISGWESAASEEAAR